MNYSLLDRGTLYEECCECHHERLVTTWYVPGIPCENCQSKKREWRLLACVDKGILVVMGETCCDR